jgi:hypothetical protein
MATQKFIGYHADESLPIKRGDVVTILKGTVIRTPHLAVKERVAGRTYKVRVHHVLNGVTISQHACSRGETPGPKRNPSVVWAGTGGYWCEVDINDVPETNR